MLADTTNPGTGMEQLNQHIFLFLNSRSMFVRSGTDHLAVFLADWLIWVIPALLAAMWFMGDVRRKQVAVRAGLTAALALGIGALIGWLWPHPRPFMIAMGHMLVLHAPDASLPSDHLTLWWSIALALAYAPGLKRAGLLLGLAGLVLAWARIYIGVHFPFDMVAAFLVALVSAQVVHTVGQPLIGKITLVGMQLQDILTGHRLSD